MNKKRIVILFIGILLIASFLRIYKLPSTPPGLFIDEAMDGNNALEAIETGHTKIFYSEDNGREGLYINLLVPLIERFGNEPWVVRLPAVIAGILTVLGMFFLTKELFSKNMALVTSFFLATSFWHINFSRIAFRGILAPLILIWTLYLLLRAYRTKSSLQGTALAILAGLVYGLGFYTYIAFRITPLLFLLFIPYFKKIPHFWKRSLIFVAIACVVALPLAGYFIQHPNDFSGRSGQVSVTHAAHPVTSFLSNAGATLQMLIAVGDHNWRHNISKAPELFIGVGVLFVLGLCFTLFALFSKKKKNDFSRFALWLSLAWLFLGLVPSAASNEGIPHALRSILMFPPALFLATIGSKWAYDQIEKMNLKKFRGGLCVLFLFVVLFVGYRDYFFTWAKNPNVPSAFQQENVAVANAINSLPSGSPVFVTINDPHATAQDIPLKAGAIMFLTDSFTKTMQEKKKISYLLMNQVNEIPSETPANQIFLIR